jgi:hypothetical protein
LLLIAAVYPSGRLRQRLTFWFFQSGFSSCDGAQERLGSPVMELKTKEPKTEVPFDPVLFAAVVPSRKPSAKDLEDTNERLDDAIEPKELTRPASKKQIPISFFRPGPFGGTGTSAKLNFY